ncbi:uncharacterized protein LOC113796912 [Dermatophagoides pteronyssinus]|uniref:uncharacterized protein LOC113796912 n=1 Tax=Dermatophagoides pteronyssinus TaxID=6956 RepID=UPI003F672CFC
MMMMMMIKILIITLLLLTLSSSSSIMNGNSPVVHFLGGIGNIHKLYHSNNHTIKDLYRLHLKFHQFMADGLLSSTTPKPAVKNDENMAKFWLNYQNFIFYPTHHHHHHHGKIPEVSIPDDSWWWWPSLNETIHCEDEPTITPATTTTTSTTRKPFLIPNYYFYDNDEK